MAWSLLFMKISILVKKKEKIKMCGHIECPYRKRCKFSPDYDPEYESDGYWKSIFGWMLPEDSDEVEGCFAYLDI